MNVFRKGIALISRVLRTPALVAGWFAVNLRHLREKDKLLAGSGRPAVLMALVEPEHPYYLAIHAGVTANGWRVIWLPRAWDLIFSQQLFLYLALCPHVDAVHLIDIDMRNLFGYSNFIRRQLSFFTLRLITAWPRLLGKMTVYSFGNLVPHEDASDTEYRRHRLVCSLVDRVISMSPSMTRSLLEDGLPAQRIWPVECPDLSPYHRAPDNGISFRRQFNIADDAIVLLLIGIIRPYKGLEIAIESFRRVSNPRLRLVIAGNPAAGYTPGDVARLAAGDPRIILGPLRFLGNAEMGWMVQSADFCLLPYLDIAQSGLVCLSLGFGVPVIASRVGCLPDYLASGAGLLFAPGDAQDLARVLDSQLTSFDRGRARSIGLAMMGKRTPEQIGKRLVSIYTRANGLTPAAFEWLF